MKYLQKTIEYGLYLLVFLLPVQTRYFLREFSLGGWSYEYGSISIYGTDILLFVLLVLFLIFVARSNFKARELDVVWGAIAVLEFSIFFSIFISTDKWAAIYGYIRFLLGVGLFGLLVYASYDKLKLIYSFVGGIFLQSCFGIWQFLSQSSFSSKWLGVAVHSGGDLGTSIVETINGERWLRAYGGLDHPNMLGGSLVIAISFLVLLYLKEVNKINNKDIECETQDIDKFKIKNIKSKILKICIFYFVFCVLLTALFFSFSRAAWAGFIVFLLVVIIVSFWLKLKNNIVIALKFFLVCVVLGSVLMFIYSDLVLSRLSTDTRTEIMSISERASMYDIAERLIRDNWLLGVGINNYGVTVEKELRQNAPYYFYQPVHNVFVLIWAEVGIVGLITFICLILNTTYLIRQKLRKQLDNKENMIYSFAVLISVLSMFLLDHWWWSLHYGVFLFWFVVGVLFRNLTEEIE